MNKTEFVGQFERLTRGFKHEATQEQAEAWYRRLSHWELADWAEAVTTLLCAPRFPYLDAVIEALDEAARHRRARALQCERKQAERVYTEIQAGEGGPLSPVLVRAISAFCGREEIRRCVAIVTENKGRQELSPSERQREIARLRTEEQRLTAELANLLPLLSDEDTAQFVARYGNAVAT